MPASASASFGSSTRFESQRASSTIRRRTVIAPLATTAPPTGSRP
jgi:hypothetical protein